jgi:hypothetical protein
MCGALACGYSIAQDSGDESPSQEEKNDQDQDDLDKPTRQQKKAGGERVQPLSL